MAIPPQALDREVAVARMRRIEELVERLEAHLPRVTRSRPDSEAWLAGERLLEQALRTATRLGTQLVAAGNLGAPESPGEVYACLGEAHILPRELARSLAGLVDELERFEDGVAALDARAVRGALEGAPGGLRAFLRSVATRIGHEPA